MESYGRVVISTPSLYDPRTLLWLCYIVDLFLKEKGNMLFLIYYAMSLLSKIGFHLSLFITNAFIATMSSTREIQNGICTFPLRGKLYYTIYIDASSLTACIFFSFINIGTKYMPRCTVPEFIPIKIWEECCSSGIEDNYYDAHFEGRWVIVVEAL